MIPHTNADNEIARYSLIVDRKLWRTLKSIQLNLTTNYVLNHTPLSEMAQDLIEKIAKEKEEIENAHKTTRDKENTAILNWTV